MQSNADHPPPLTMKAFWHDFSEEVLSLDRGLPWTFARMGVAPGRLIRRYVDLRDPRIVRPLRYFLVGFALLALVFQGLGGIDAAREGFIQGAKAEGAADEKLLAMWAVFEQIEWLLLVVMLPALAGSLCLGYRRYRPTFAETWVLCLFLVGHVMLLEAIVLALGDWVGVPGMSLLALILPCAYFVVTCVGFFPGSMGSRVARSLVAGTLGLLFITLGLFAVLVGAAILGGILGPG